MTRLLLVFGVVLVAGGWLMFAVAPGERARPPVPEHSRTESAHAPTAPAPREVVPRPTLAPLAHFGDTRFRHPYPVDSKVFSADGTLIATTTDKEHTLRVWEVATGRLVWQHTESVGVGWAGSEIVAVPRDGRWIVVLFGNRVVVTFAIGTGHVVSRFGIDHHITPLLTLAPNGKLLAGRLGEDHLALWDLATGIEVRRFKGQFQRYRICFSPDGTQVAASPDGGSVWWAPVDGSGPERTFRMPKGLHHMCLVGWPRADRLVASEGQNQLVFDPTSGKLIVHRPTAGEDEPAWLFQGTDGRLMGYLGRKDYVGRTRHTEVSADTLKPVGAVIEVPDSRAAWTTESPDGRWLADSYGHALVIRDAKTDKNLHPDLDRHPVSPVTTFIFSDDGKRMVTCESRSTAILWDPAARAPLFALGNVYRTAPLSRDGRWATRRNENYREVRDTTSGAVLVREPPRDERAWDYELGYDSSGHLWTRWDPSGAITQREMPSGKVVQTVPGLPVGDWPAALVSPDGRTAVLGQHGALAVRRTNPESKWNNASRPPLYVLTERNLDDVRFGHPSFPHSSVSLAFTPNSRWLVVGETHGHGPKKVSRIEMWDVRGQPVLAAQWPKEEKQAVSDDLATLDKFLKLSARERNEGDDAYLNGFALSPDGRRLAFWISTASAETKEVRVWETATWTEAYRFAPPGGLSAFGFMPGDRFLIGRPDTTLSLWDGAAVERSCLGTSTDTAEAALASSDPKIGLQAVHALVADPKQAVAVLAAQFRLPDRAAITARIEELADDDFVLRERASQALAAFGMEAEPALREVMRSSPSPEARGRAARLLVALSPTGQLTAAQVRAVRAVEALERIASPEAKELLRMWAINYTSTVLGAEAAAALQRLDSRRP